MLAIPVLLHHWTMNPSSLVTNSQVSDFGRSDFTDTSLLIDRYATSCSGLFFATFNIQNFGKTKASRPAVLHALSETIARYNLVAIQELSQMPIAGGPCGAHTASAICDLLSAVNARSSRSFKVAASPRIGDEQYTLLYDSASISVLSGATYPDTKHIHARPPHAFKLQVGSSASIVVVVTHTSPSDARAEIENFPAVLKWTKSKFRSDYTLFAGDFNGDGRYFDEGQFAALLGKMPGFRLLTGNELDSTVAPSANTYDRIIVSKELRADAPSVFRFESELDLSGVMIEGCAEGYVPEKVCSSRRRNLIQVGQELSDHYPVEVCLHVPISSPRRRRRRRRNSR